MDKILSRRWQKILILNPPISILPHYFALDSMQECIKLSRQVVYYFVFCIFLYVYKYVLTYFFFKKKYF